MSKIQSQKAVRAQDYTGRARLSTWKKDPIRPMEKKVCKSRLLAGKIIHLTHVQEMADDWLFF